MCARLRRLSPALYLFVWGECDDQIHGILEVSKWLVDSRANLNFAQMHASTVTFERSRTLFVIVFYRMDSGDCNGVRPRMRIIPEMPAFPDLKSPIVMEGSQAEERQSFGDHINSNGGNK